LGAGVVVAAVVPLAAWPIYRGFDRFLPLLAGIGICLLGLGPPGLWRRRNELSLLALPVMNPLPQALRLAMAPTSLTASCASFIGRAMGHSMAADATVVRMPTGTLDVLEGCDGLLSIGRLLVLTAITFALFPTSARQKTALVASTVVTGFVSNALRIEMLAVTVAKGDAGSFAYWHTGHGASIFALATTVVAGALWWLILRPMRSARGTDATTPTSPATLT
jgi:cyanoexosortase A